MKIIRALLLAVSAVASLPAYSHEMIPGYWCTEIETTPKIIALFDFDEKALRDVIDKCGIVDSNKNDHWHVTVGAIQYFCETQLPEGSAERKSVVPFITGPETFNHDDHHDLYAIDQGLVGSCVVCVPIENKAVPITPTHRDGYRQAPRRPDAADPLAPRDPSCIAPARSKPNG